MYYSTNGIKWNKIENPLEVSGKHHNVLGGFMSFRIGLYSMSEGKVRFKKFPISVNKIKRVLPGNMKLIILSL